MEYKDQRHPDKSRALEKEGHRKKISKAIAAIIAKALIIIGPHIGLDEPRPDASPFPKDKTEQEIPAEEKSQEKTIRLKPESEISPEQSELYRYCSRFLNYATNASENDPNKPMLPILLLAMSAHETGFGESELAQKANNFFGVIAKDGWEGEVYEKITHEFIPEAELANYENKPGFEIIKGEDGVIEKDEKGNYKVQYLRPFRKYPNAQSSFMDTVETKIYHQNLDGGYRYQDAINYLKNGGDDPTQLAELIGPNDEGRASWATDVKWTDKVQALIEEIEAICIQESVEEKPKTENENEINSVIDIEALDFDELTDQTDKPVIERMKKAFQQVSLEKFDKYRSEGITKIGRNEYITLLAGQPGKGRTPAEHYEDAYSKPIESFDYIILHIMAIERGSEKITLKQQLQSWFNARSASTQWLMSDNIPVDVWQISPTKSSSQAWHIANGVMDSGRIGRENVSNRNSVGIEVQANDIFDVKTEQYEAILYWAADLLIESGKVNKEMSDAEIDEIINRMVIGHGQNLEEADDDSGLEFGYDYVRPIQDALKQLIKAELRRN